MELQMKRQRRDSLIVPVETLNREFDGKLLLALIAAEKGWRAILGGQTPLHHALPLLPRSLYFAKSARSQNSKLFQIMREMGFGIVAQDEEALVRQSDEIYAYKHDHGAFANISALFAWGQENVEVWNHMLPGNTLPILPFGNPRADMMRADLRAYHKPEMDAIRERFGEFVLLNTNFAAVNHFIAGETRFQLSKRTPKEQFERMRNGVVGHKQQLFDRFKVLVPSLARAVHPKLLVIRPHPSESQLAWDEVATSEPNIRVVHEGSVIPWLAAAAVVLQNGCTSAVEAAAIGTPIVSYRPVVSDEFDPPLPNQISINCFDDASTIATIKAILDGTAIEPRRNAQLLDHYVAALHGPLSTERIVDFLTKLEPEKISPPSTVSRWIKAFVRHQRMLMRRRWTRFHRGSSAKRNEYIEHKFPPITVDFVQERMARFRKTLGRFDDISLRQVRPSIFELVKH
jgi:surface carbohydrate biosynthesis protein